MADVDIPTVGKVDQKYVAFAAVGLVAFVGYRYYKAKSTAAAAPPAPQIDPSTGLPIDPTTGLDVGSGGSTSDYGMGMDTYSGIDATTGQPYTINPATGYPYGVNGPDPNAVTFTTNAEWTQAAVTYLTGAPGYDGGTVLAALALYLGGRQLSDAQGLLVRQAIAALGPPPVGQFAILTGPAAPPAATVPAALSGLHVTGTTDSSIALAWDASSGADSYRIDEHSDLGGSTQTTTGTSYNKTGLHYDLLHTFVVTPMNSSGDGPSQTVQGKTNPQAAPPPPPPPAQQRTYTIQSGDTLWAIASRYYGNPNRWPDIFSANAGTLDAAARAHGKGSSENGHWIYPGTTIVIP